MKINSKKRTIYLEPEEIAMAIESFLVAHGVHVSGPRTIRTYEDREFLQPVEVWVDPSGKVHRNSVVEIEEANEQATCGYKDGSGVYCVRPLARNGYCEAHNEAHGT